MRQTATGQQQVVLPFAQIEVGPLGHPLPHQARQRRQRWCNDGTEPHAWYGWLRVGWFVGPISLATEMVVTFTRGNDLV